MADAPRFTDNIEEMLNAAAERAIALTACSIVPPKLYITNLEAASRLDISGDTLSAWRSRGDGPPWVGAGKLVRYSIRAIDEWLAALPRTEK